MLGARPACLSVPVSSVVVAEQGGDEVLGPDEVILCGRLKTLSLSEILMFCSAIWIFPNATSKLLQLLAFHVCSVIHLLERMW